MTDARHVGWALFFGVVFSAIGVYIVSIANQRSPEDGRLVYVVALIPLLLGGRFLFAGLTGRIPSWMEELIDDPEG